MTSRAAEPYPLGEFLSGGLRNTGRSETSTDVAPAVAGLRVFLSIPALLVYSESMAPNCKASPAYVIRVRSVLLKVESDLDDRQRKGTLVRTLRAANEYDPQRLHALLVEINRLLEERERQLLQQSISGTDSAG